MVAIYTSHNDLLVCVFFMHMSLHVFFCIYGYGHLFVSLSLVLNSIYESLFISCCFYFCITNDTDEYYC